MDPDRGLAGPRGDLRPSTFFSFSLRRGRGCSVRTSAGCWLPCCCLPPTPGPCSRTTPSLGLRTGRTFRGLASTRTSSPKKREAGHQPAPFGPNVLCLDVSRPEFPLPTRACRTSGKTSQQLRNHHFPPRSVSVATPLALDQRLRVFTHLANGVHHTLYVDVK